MKKIEANIFNNSDDSHIKLNDYEHPFILDFQLYAKAGEKPYIEITYLAVTKESLIDDKLPKLIIDSEDDYLIKIKRFYIDHLKIEGSITENEEDIKLINSIREHWREKIG